MPMRLNKEMLYWPSQFTGAAQERLNKFRRKQERKSRLVDNSSNSFALIDVVKISNELRGVDQEHDLKPFQDVNNCYSVTTCTCSRASRLRHMTPKWPDPEIENSIRKPKRWDSKPFDNWTRRANEWAQWSALAERASEARGRSEQCGASKWGIGVSESKSWWSSGPDDFLDKMIESKRTKKKKFQDFFCFKLRIWS